MPAMRRPTERFQLTINILPLLSNFSDLEVDINLQDILAILGIVLFVVSMVRVCGGMMSGGCGMGSRGADQRRPHDQQEGADLKQSPEPAEISSSPALISSSTS
jgi:hypothetical protein